MLCCKLHHADDVAGNEVEAGKRKAFDRIARSRRVVTEG